MFPQHRKRFAFLGVKLHEDRFAVERLGRALLPGLSEIHELVGTRTIKHGVVIAEEGHTQNPNITMFRICQIDGHECRSANGITINFCGFLLVVEEELVMSNRGEQAVVDVFDFVFVGVTLLDERLSDDGYVRGLGQFHHVRLRRQREYILIECERDGGEVLKVGAIQPNRADAFGQLQEGLAGGCDEAGAGVHDGGTRARTRAECTVLK